MAGQPRGRGHPGGPARGRDHLAGAGRPAHGRAARPGAAAAGGRDAGLGERHLHRQDRHPDREPHAGGAPLDAGRPNTASTATATHRRVPGAVGVGRCVLPCVPPSGRRLQRRHARAHPTAAASWTITGDPTEGALLAFAAKWASSRRSRPMPARGEVGFDATRRRMTTDPRSAVAAPSRRSEPNWVAVKGALEAHRAAARRGPRRTCSGRGPGGGRAVRADGYRVLALAERGIAERARRAWHDAEQGLRLVGIVAMADPPRAAAAAAIAAGRAGRHHPGHDHRRSPADGHRHRPPAGRARRRPRVIDRRGAGARSTKTTSRRRVADVGGLCPHQPRAEAAHRRCLANAGRGGGHDRRRRQRRPGACAGPTSASPWASPAPTSARKRPTWSLPTTTSRPSWPRSRRGGASTTTSAASSATC